MSNFGMRHPAMATLAVAAVACAAITSAGDALAGGPGDRRACVTGAGLLVGSKSKGVTGVVKNVGLGHYTVSFNKVVVRCVKVATLGFCNATPPRPGEIAVSDGAASNAVQVKTYTSSGISFDRDFNLYVDCD